MHGKIWQISIGYSVKLVRYLLILHLMLIGGVWLVPLFWLWQLLLSLVLLGSLFFYLKRYATDGGRQQLTSIERNSAGQWRLNYAEHSSSWLQLQAAYCAFFGVILYFKRKQFGTKALFIASDAVESDALRKLQIYVRDVRSYRR